MSYIPNTAVNTRLLDTDAFIKKNRIGRVTSLAIHAPSSTSFHPEGAFSEEIFGAIGSRERLLTFGYIELNTAIIAPEVYQHVLKLNSLYESIMSGEAYAVFDEEKMDFIRVNDSPENVPGAGTGYSFFMAHMKKIQYTEGASAVRQNRISMIEKYKDVMIYQRLLVLPAGLREIAQDGVRMVQDDINTLYRSLLSYTIALPPGSASTIYDPIRYKIQVKAFEIFSYIEAIFKGKPGFMQKGGYGNRGVALGTRNVITAANYVMEDPDDVQALRPNEVKTGIFQTAKGLQPIVSYYLRTIFFDPILQGGDTSRVPLIDPKTLSLQYVEVSALVKEAYLSSDGIEKRINRFRNVDVRWNPVTIMGTDKKEYYAFLIYDQGNRISLFRSLEDLKSHLPEGAIVDKSAIRPLTWAEMLYMATYHASVGRHVMITRYPVIEDGSVYPAKINLVSVSPARVVSLYDLISGRDTVSYPQYPVVGPESTFLDSAVVHSGNLKGLGGDHDGDMISCNFIMADDSNAEIADYFKKTRAFLTPERRLITGSPSDLVVLSYISLSQAPKS